jgi:cytosine deaminase
MDAFMQEAITEARKGLAEGGIPIGSVLVRKGKIIGRGHNRRVQKNNPMIHAEIDCLMEAGRIGKYGDTVLYSTLMPCFLCAGAAVQFGIKKVIVAESRNFQGARAFMEEHGIEVIDLDDRDWALFFKKWCDENSALWNEDIGEN